ncbi:O-methyltransferase [Flavobacterium pallidum]|uniref:Methyltransferase n=1 Tax=Flavobacterium pallidum TaxID=2172098 RepID=A0A2S1SLF0_9FLAO|nr:class I SAM-dependent methyltransferase [Flavobacterium pallidum]AWI27230.1 methyltransferase [Flavobacterium pallidum]
MIFQVKSYLKFLWKSTNEHGVHSPFVFSLVTKCFYCGKHDVEYGILREFRKSLVNNHQIIDVTDFGVGSKVFRSDQRTIAAIAKNAGISAKRAELLFRISKYFQPKNILEIGSSIGLATSALAAASPHAKITTLEGCPETAAVAKKQFEKFGFRNIDVLIGEFEDSFASLQSVRPNWDLVYFDGNHTSEATLQYFDILLPTVTNNSVWIFDDIHWSADMESAWEMIKEHPKVTVSIDTFQWGIVFFRKEQEKEDFIIRI